MNHISWMIHLRLPRKHVLCVCFLLFHAIHSAEPHKLAAAQPEEPPTVITNSIGMKLALIPAGTFLMGSPDSEVGRSKDDGPPHRVLRGGGWNDKPALCLSALRSSDSPAFRYYFIGFRVVCQ